MFFWRAGMILVFAEILLFIAVVGAIGFFATLGFLILSALVGGYLVRAQGFATLMKAQQSFDHGAMPMDQIFESLCLLIAGLLFILPGFLSDAIGFMLLFPMVRKTVKERSAGKFGFKEDDFRPRDDGVIDGTYEVIEEEVIRIEPKPPQN